MFISFLSLASIFIAVFLFSLWRPRMAIFLPIIFHESFLVKTKIFFIPSTGLEMLIIGVLAGVWIDVYYQIIRKHKKQYHPREGSPRWSFGEAGGDLLVIVILILLFVFSSTVSAVIAPHFTTAWGAWKALIIEPILYAVTLILVVKRYNLWSRLIVALLWGGIVSCLLSLVFWRFGTDFWRFRGIYDVPNSLALILAPVLVTAVLVFWERATLGMGSFKNQKLFLGIAICIFSILLLATQSITGVFSVVTSLAAISLIKKKFSRRIMAGLFMIVLLAIGAQTFSGKITHLLSRISSSFIAREQIWMVAGLLIKDHASLGTGLGTFEPAYQEKLKTMSTNFSSLGVLEWVVRDPHNIFLSFWLNTGFLGFLSMAALVATGIKKSTLTAGSFTLDNQYRMIAGAAMLTLIVFGLFDVPYWKNDLAMLWWVYLVGSIL